TIFAIDGRSSCRLELEVDEGYRLGPRKQRKGHEGQGRARDLAKHSSGDQPVLKSSTSIDRDPKKDGREQDGEPERNMQAPESAGRGQIAQDANRLCEAAGPKRDPPGA